MEAAAQCTGPSGSAAQWRGDLAVQPAGQPGRGVEGGREGAKRGEGTGAGGRVGGPMAGERAGRGAGWGNEAQQAYIYHGVAYIYRDCSVHLP